MTRSKKSVPDFFSDEGPDPVTAATGGPKVSGGAAKKKAGFYLAADLLDRFDRTFYRLKLEGAGIVNKSALVEAALSFALDDMEKGEKSAFRKLINGV
ncbi:MAG: hypothetical protein ACOZBW_07850 [Thermodesulfobacteriota bacterium]